MGMGWMGSEDWDGICGMRWGWGGWDLWDEMRMGWVGSVG